MDNSEDIKVYVVSHAEKDIRAIESDDIYTPLFVGRNGQDNFGFCSDDTGDNISNKNSYYCELTGLYWMCKNSPADIIGLVHYRRLFAKSRFGKYLSREDILDALSSADIIVPKKVDRLEGSAYDAFKRDELIKVLMDESRVTVEKLFPEYLESFDKIMYHDEKIAFFNMFIGRKDLMVQYCDWIFPILDDLLGRIDLHAPYHRSIRIVPERIFGVLSEILFNVWIDHNNLREFECPLRYKGFRISLRMFLLNRPLFRKGYKYILYPILEKINYFDRFHNKVFRSGLDKI